MKNVTEAELWELILQAGEAAVKLSELQLKLVNLAMPAVPLLEPTYPPPVLEPLAVAPKDKDVPF